jgi:urate oxidase
MIDVGAVRTPPQRPLDPQHGLVVSLDQGLDGSIGQIADVAVHALEGRLILNEEPETDALHTPTDDESLRDDHENRRLSPGLPRLCNAPGRIERADDACYSSRMPRLGASSQGESRLRMLRIVRKGDRHDPRDLTVSVRFEGGFAGAFLEGRADGIIPGETLKGFVHQVARDHAGAEIEIFGLALCQRMLAAHRQVTRVRVEISEQPWSRMDVGGKAQGQAFAVGSPEQRITAVTSNGTQIAVVSGIDQLVLMRTSGFLPRRVAARADDGTEDAVQSLLVGTLSVRWTYSNADVTFGPYRQGVRAAITDTFALHAARSIQYTLYAIADVVLATYEEILDVTLAMHERPYRAADLFRQQLENPDELFVAAEEPLGVVEVTVERDPGPHP